MKQRIVEDYLKTIYMLSEGQAPVSTARLARSRGVSASSASSTMQRLAQEGWVTYEKQVGVALTSRGEKVALHMLRRHRLLELYLVQEMGYGWDEVHDEAEQMEHAISERFVQSLVTVLGEATADPHGDPIPAADGSIEAVSAQALSMLQTGETAVVHRIGDDTDCDLLRHLSTLGLIPGATVRVLDKAPFDGPLTLEIDDQRKIVGLIVADIIQVIIA